MDYKDGMDSCTPNDENAVELRKRVLERLCGLTAGQLRLFVAEAELLAGKDANLEADGNTDG